MNDDKYREYLKSEKWKRIAAERMRIDGHKCVMCGSRGSSTNPLEVHHLSYKWIYQEETRIYQDLCTLCHACHKSIHNVMNRQTDPNGRHGWKDNSNIPAVSVFTLTGQEIESREVKNNA